MFLLLVLLVTQEKLEKEWIKRKSTKELTQWNVLLNMLTLIIWCLPDIPVDLNLVKCLRKQLKNQQHKLSKLLKRMRDSNTVKRVLLFHLQKELHLPNKLEIISLKNTKNLNKMVDPEIWISSSVNLGSEKFFKE